MQEQEVEKGDEQLLGVGLSGSDLPLLEVGLLGENGFGGLSDLQEEKKNCQTSSPPILQQMNQHTLA